MSELAWAFAFMCMCGLLGGSAVGCVALSERGKTKRLVKTEETKRIGMDNAWQLESAKILQGQIGPATEVEFTLPGHSEGMMRS